MQLSSARKLALIALFDKVTDLWHLSCFSSDAVVETGIYTCLHHGLRITINGKAMTLVYIPASWVNPKRLRKQHATDKTETSGPVKLTLSLILSRSGYFSRKDLSTIFLSRERLGVWRKIPPQMNSLISFSNTQSLRKQN